MLGEVSHRHLISVIVNCCKPVEAWHSTQNKALRSEKGTSSWILDQLEGDFMKHVNAIMLLMQDVLVLEECGILQQYDGDDNCIVLQQEELAETFGDFSMLLASKRVQRTLWFVCGLPHRLPLVLSKKNGVPEAVLKNFNVDYQCYVEAVEVAKTVQAAAPFVRRSVFRHKSVDLHVQAVFA